MQIPLWYAHTEGDGAERSELLSVSAADVFELLRILENFAWHHSSPASSEEAQAYEIVQRMLRSNDHQ